MKEIYVCDNYKVLEVTLNAGEKMPLHEATSNAFLICKKGKGKITFSDKVIELGQNETLLIKANEKHKVEILEDFCTDIILDGDGRINFLKQETKQVAEDVY